jgi:hypothetical protein
VTSGREGFGFREGFGEGMVLVGDCGRKGLRRHMPTCYGSPMTETYTRGTRVVLTGVTGSRHGIVDRITTAGYVVRQDYTGRAVRVTREQVSAR